MDAASGLEMYPAPGYTAVTFCSYSSILPTNCMCGTTYIHVKVKESRNSPGVAQGVPGGLGSKVESRNSPGVAQRVPGGLGFQISMIFGT
jgi:hypothetical protein